MNEYLVGVCVVVLIGIVSIFAAWRSNRPVSIAGEQVPMHPSVATITTPLKWEHVKLASERGYAVLGGARDGSVSLRVHKVDADRTNGELVLELTGRDTPEFWSDAMAKLLALPTIRKVDFSFLEKNS